MSETPLRDGLERLARRLRSEAADEQRVSFAADAIDDLLRAVPPAPEAAPDIQNTMRDILGIPHPAAPAQAPPAPPDDFEVLENEIPAGVRSALDAEAEDALTMTPPAHPDALRALSDELDVRAVAGSISFVVRTGDGAPFTVYLKPQRASVLRDELAAVLDRHAPPAEDINNTVRDILGIPRPAPEPAPLQKLVEVWQKNPPEACDHIFNLADWSEREIVGRICWKCGERQSFPVVAEAPHAARPSPRAPSDLATQIRALPRYETHEVESLRGARVHEDWLRWSDLAALLPPADGQP